MIQLPSRPPLPPCPGHERHLFSGGALCRRCRRPRRRWTDYDYDGHQGLKGVLYRWLVGELDDDTVCEAIHALGYGVAQTSGILTLWSMVRDGHDLVAGSAVVELWETEDGQLYVVAAGTPSIAFYGLGAARTAFSDDARRLADAGAWPGCLCSPEHVRVSGAVRVAVWEAGAGPRLTPADGHAGRTACRYLGIERPSAIAVPTAADVLRRTQETVRRLVRSGVLLAENTGAGLLLDPLRVHWYATQLRERERRAELRRQPAGDPA